MQKVDKMKNPKLHFDMDLGGFAEREGFEPPVPCGTHAFQACHISHSCTSPVSFYTGFRRKGCEIRKYP
jgi:hypothetical protein